MAWRPSKRERWCLVVLPALAVVGGYLFGVMRPADRRLKATREQITQISKSPLSPAAVVEQHNRLQQMLGLLDAERDRAERLKPRGATATSKHASDSAASLELVAKVIDGHGLLLLGSSRVAESEARPLVPPQLRPAADSGPGQAAGAGRQVWRFEIEGSYSSVLECLEAIGAMDRLVIPLNVSMDSGRTQGGLRHWTIWLYV